MSFLKRILGKQTAEGPTAVDGGWLLTRTFERAYSRLAEGEIEDVYRASLYGGSRAAHSVLALDDGCRALWGHGTQARAAALLEVWASTLAALLLPWKTDRDEVVLGVGLGLSSILGMEPGTGKGALDTFLYHMERNHMDPTAVYAWCILEARVVQALTENPVDFRQFAHPNFTHAELLRVTGGPSSDVLALGTLPFVTAEAMKVAKEHFQQLSN